MFDRPGFVLSAILISYLLWRVVRRFVLSHPLDNIPGPPTKYTIAGNFPDLFKKDAWGFHRYLAETYGKFGVARIAGPLGARWLLVHDSKAMQHIFLKDQHIFEEGSSTIAENRAIFGNSLISTVGSVHRKQRKMLNPVFSIAHMRNMIPIFFKTTYKLRDAFLLKTADGATEVDLSSWMTRIALELVGQSGLGKSFDPLTEGHQEHMFTSSVKLLIPAMQSLRLVSFAFMPLIDKYNLGTARIRRFIVDSLPWKSLHRVRDIADTMYNTSVAIFDEKKKSYQNEKDGQANQSDFLSILVRENAKANSEDRLPDDEVLAQISLLMFAAMDTTSSALSRILWLLATHPKIQARLRAEIREAKEGYEEPTYDQLSALPYLDAICRETLRLYPPAPMVLRETLEDTILPFSKPITTVDGKETHEVHVPKGTTIVVSIQASNTDPALWGDDSYEWKPERWLAPLPDSITEARLPAIYSNLMTFIGGGRSCIGFKFSQMEMKVILYVLLDLFQFSLPKQEIFWNMGGIVTPCVDRDQLRPEMPLTITRAN